MKTIKSAYINLPIKNITATRKFWEALGFSFNEQFSDEKALCLVLQPERLYAMLITHPFFSTFTDRKIADGSTTQVLLAIEVESRTAVDEMVSKALKHGGSRFRDAADHEWMYYDTFADIDGHQWEVMYMDVSKMKNNG